MRVGLYNSTFTTESAGVDITIPSNSAYENQRYIKVISTRANNTGGALEGYIDDLQVWKSCSDCDASWKERGTA